MLLPGGLVAVPRNQVVSLGLFCIGTVDFLLTAALFDNPRLRRIGAASVGTALLTRDDRRATRGC